MSPILLLLTPHAESGPYSGPTAGFKKRRQAANDGESTSTPDATISPDTTATTSEAPGPCPESASSGPRQKVPLLGLPRQMIDELLAVYFTHVHVSLLMEQLTEYN